MSTCYMCQTPATSAEHVPPLSFFPTGYRDGLWTVPSCAVHNEHNSRDVEYVRSIIAMSAGTNDIARTLVREKVRRSWERSPRLKSQTFRRFLPALLNGRRTAVVEADLSRFNSIISSIASAIYFKDFGSPWKRDWLIYGSTLIPLQPIVEGRSDQLNPQVRATLNILNFSAHPTPQPMIFCYETFSEGSEDIIYKFIFYEGVVVYAVAGYPATGGRDVRSGQPGS
jgi:hypothetical protein